MFSIIWAGLLHVNKLRSKMWWYFVLSKAEDVSHRETRGCKIRVKLFFSFKHYIIKMQAGPISAAPVFTVSVIHGFGTTLCAPPPHPLMHFKPLQGWNSSCLVATRLLGGGGELKHSQQKVVSLFLLILLEFLSSIPANGKQPARCPKLVSL